MRYDASVRPIGMTVREWHRTRPKRACMVDATTTIAMCRRCEHVFKYQRRTRPKLYCPQCMSDKYRDYNAEHRRQHKEALDHATRTQNVAKALRLALQQRQRDDAGAGGQDARGVDAGGGVGGATEL